MLSSTITFSFDAVNAFKISIHENWEAISNEVPVSSIAVAPVDTEWSPILALKNVTT